MKDNFKTNPMGRELTDFEIKFDSDKEKLLIFMSDLASHIAQMDEKFCSKEITMLPDFIKIISAKGIFDEIRDSTPAAALRIGRKWCDVVIEEMAKLKDDSIDAALEKRKTNTFLVLRDAVRDNVAQENFPVGTVIDDFSISPTTGSRVADPFIIVSYTDVRHQDEQIPRMAAVLLRKYATKLAIEKDNLKCAQSVITYLDRHNGYLSLISDELKEAVPEVTRRYLASTYTYGSRCAESKDEICQFFLPSPKNLGFKVTDIHSSELYEDTETWEYFIGDEPSDSAQNVAKLRAATTHDGEPVTYMTRCRDNTGDTLIKGCNHQVTTDGNKKNSTVFIAIRPACYIF